MKNLSPLQKKLLEMLGWFHDFCVENGLRYYVLGGTLLGAMRHQGFIPWDDDVDVALPRRDYERLCKIFRDPTEKYVLETPYSEAPDYLYGMSKMYDTTTTLIDNARIEIKRGVYLDVFPLDGIGNSYEESLHNFTPSKILGGFVAARRCNLREGRKWYKNGAILAARMIPSFLVDEKKIIRRLDRLHAARDFDRCRYVMNSCGNYGKKEIVERRVFGSPKEYRFENLTVFGPEQGDEYLRNVYGNWRQLPPEKQRKSNHGFLMVDLNTPYVV